MSESPEYTRDRVDPAYLRCPEQHHDLVDTSGPTDYCKGCGHTYRYVDFIDSRTPKHTVEPPRIAEH
jgi:hypothetical protein